MEAVKQLKKQLQQFPDFEIYFACLCILVTGVAPILF